MRPPHCPHQENGEEGIRPPRLLGFSFPSHLLRTGLSPGQRDRHLHSPLSAATARMVSNQAGCLRGLAGKLETNRSPKPWYSIAGAQLILVKLPAFPGAPTDPSHALYHTPPPPAQLPCLHWALQAPSRGTYREWGCSGAACPSLPLQYLSSSNIIKSNYPYFPWAWISFPSSWHYCFLHGSISSLPVLASFYNGLNCFD